MKKLRALVRSAGAEEDQSCGGSDAGSMTMSPERAVRMMASQEAREAQKAVPVGRQGRERDRLMMSSF